MDSCYKENKRINQDDIFLLSFQIFYSQSPKGGGTWVKLNIQLHTKIDYNEKTEVIWKCKHFCIVNLEIKHHDLHLIQIYRFISWLVVVKPFRDNFNWGIKQFSSNLVPTLNIEIKCSRLRILHTKIPTSCYLTHLNTEHDENGYIKVWNFKFVQLSVYTHCPNIPG